MFSVAMLYLEAIVIRYLAGELVVPLWQHCTGFSGVGFAEVFAVWPTLKEGCHLLDT